MTGRKGLWIVLGLGGIVFVAGALFVGVIVFTVVHDLDVHSVPAASAEEQYYRLRDRFAGQTPLLEIDRDNPRKILVHRRSERAGAGEITSMRVFAWNPRDRKMVHLELPLWLLRLQLRSNSVDWHWAGDELDLKIATVTLEDIENHGRGLILDYESRQGARVVLWAE